MQVSSHRFDVARQSWDAAPQATLDSTRTLILAFGAPTVPRRSAALRELARTFPKSIVVGCSSAGEIHGTTVSDESLSVTVARFAKSDLTLASVAVSEAKESFAAGETLGKKLVAARNGLRAILVLSEGLHVNGSELVRGLNSCVGTDVVVTGGLAGDGTAFGKTWVSIGGEAKEKIVVAIGFYGPALVVGHGSKGGWDRFGPERVVTRSEGNVLFELDGKPALALYKEYLGARAKDLPSSGLLFPLAMRSSAQDTKVLVRTLLAVDEAKQSMTFAGDVSTGSLVQLMRADFPRLVAGASSAADMALGGPAPAGNDLLAVAISCVGRRLVLGDRTEEEVEAVHDALPKAMKKHLTGFYSYGEISPFAQGHADLHNQTMTLTLFSENEALPDASQPTTRPAPPKPVALPSARPAPASPVAKPPVPARSSAGAVEEPRRASAEHLNRETLPVTLVEDPEDAFRLAVRSYRYDVASSTWDLPLLASLDSPRTLVLAFGSPNAAKAPALGELARTYPKSIVIGCSSAGEIHGTSVGDGSLSVTVARFASTELALASATVTGPKESFSVGTTLGKKLVASAAGRGKLRGILVLSEGLQVNGSELVRGLNGCVGEDVVISGGLAGDGTAFGKTWVALGAEAREKLIVAVGLYGDDLVVGHGSKGGWDRFGPERVVTRSEGNVLFELDGKPALALYKEYLGSRAKDLPSSGLFPLAVRTSSTAEKILVRTLLAVDEAKQSMTFAGDIDEGSLVQLMRADFPRLVGGATAAVEMAKGNGAPVGKDVLAVAISCVGRRLVLGDRTEEEVEAVHDALPREMDKHLTGFYSYGEISPFAQGHADLHNQTMTLTLFSERPPTKARPVAPTMASLPGIPIEEGVTSVISSRIPGAPVSATTASRREVRKTRPMPALSGATGATLDEQKVGPVSVVRVRGRISESFQGETNGGKMVGTVVLDLAAVERITSYGVREWLSMLGAAKNATLVFARCSEAVVNQLGMIRKFAGHAQVVSFYAPYECSVCGEGFERLFDLRSDASAIQNATPPAATCPGCEGAGRFDDDAQSYFTFAQPFLQSALTPEVASALEQLDDLKEPARRDPVEKTVDGARTRVVLQTKLTADIRWARILDGIEGDFELDLGASGVPDVRAVTTLGSALATLGDEVTRATVERSPEALVARFAELGVPDKAELGSAILDCWCAACNADRPTVVGRGDGANALNCKRCGGTVRVKNEALYAFLEQHWKGRAERTAVLASMGATNATKVLAASEPIAVAPVAPSPSVAPPAAAPAPAAAAGGPSNRTLAAIVLVGLIGGGALYATRQPVATPTPPAASAVAANPSAAPSAAAVAPSAVAAASTGARPAWIERALSVDGDALIVVGHGAGANGEAAEKAAKDDAVGKLLGRLSTDLDGTAIQGFVATRKDHAQASGRRRPPRRPDARKAPPGGAQRRRQPGNPGGALGHRPSRRRAHHRRRRCRRPPPRPRADRSRRAPRARSSRCIATQHLRDHRRCCKGSRFRHRTHRPPRLGDPRRDAQGEGPLHGARAAQGDDPRSADRHLRARRRPLRAHRRPAAVPGLSELGRPADACHRAPRRRRPLRSRARLPAGTRSGRSPRARLPGDPALRNGGRICRCASRSCDASRPHPRPDGDAPPR
jgi:hypothetical protein